MTIKFDMKAMTAAAAEAAAPIVDERAAMLERNLKSLAKRHGERLIDTKVTETDRYRKTVMVSKYGMNAEAKNGMISRAAAMSGMHLGDA